MPDFKEFVREAVESLHLSSDRQDKVIGELGDQIEEVYVSILEEGFSGDAAWRELQTRIPPLPELVQELLAVEPVLTTGLRRQLRTQSARSNNRVGLFLESGLWVDLRAAFRQLAKNRMFVLVALITLSICLGANAAIFTIVDQVLLNPLSVVPDSSRIILVANQFSNLGGNLPGETSSARNYYQRQQVMKAFSTQAMFKSVDL